MYYLCMGFAGGKFVTRNIAGLVLQTEEGVAESRYRADEPWRRSGVVECPPNLTHQVGEVLLHHERIGP